MNWSDTPAGVINGAVQRLLVALGDEADTVANRMNSDPGLVARIALYAKNGGFQASTGQKRAREIMGRNFFGVEEAIKHFGVNPNPTQLAALAEVPFTEETLEACKNTHVLVAVFPLSILDVRAKFNTDRTFYDQTWYNKQAFAKNKGEIGWKLVRKTQVDNSTNKTWDEQQALLGKTDETPSAQVMVYTVIGHFKATGERLFENVYVRCSDLDSDGSRVVVGDFDAGGLFVYYYWDGIRYSIVGLASARKS